MRIAGITAIALMAAWSGGARASEIRIVPSDFIVAAPANPDKGYSDLIVHAIAVATDRDESATLDSVRVEILSHGQTKLTRDISAGEMVGATQFLAGAPIKEFVTGQVLNDQGLDGIFGRPIKLANSATMTPSQALLAMRLHFSTGFEPDTLRVTAMLSDRHGMHTVTVSIPVRQYKSPINYRLPVDGQWLMQAMPGVQSHHRFNPSTEFAVDFFKLGNDSHLLHGDKMDPTNYYGFGQSVMAIAAGTVVSVIADQVQDRAKLLLKPGENREDFYKRLNAYQMEMMRKNFRAANAGNLITIRHEKDGVVEYSSYGHLKSGSVQVKVGDHVAQGQIIAQVGDTGDSAAVHLHFQLNTGPDAFMSQSLPVIFSNLENVDGNAEPGLLITTGTVR